jgi:hypothetical protein
MYIGATLAARDIHRFFKYLPSPKPLRSSRYWEFLCSKKVNCKSAAIREGLLSWMQPPAGNCRYLRISRAEEDECTARKLKGENAASG